MMVKKRITQREKNRRRALNYLLKMTPKGFHDIDDDLWWHDFDPIVDAICVLVGHADFIKGGV
jgi:hypothetical protein